MRPACSYPHDVEPFADRVAGFGQAGVLGFDNRHVIDRARRARGEDHVGPGQHRRGNFDLEPERGGHDTVGADAAGAGDPQIADERSWGEHVDVGEGEHQTR